MAVDLSGMTLKKLEKTDWDNYPVGGESLPPHEPGVYQLRVVGHKFEPRNGYLMDAIEFAIEDPVQGKSAKVLDWLMTNPRTTGKRIGTCKAGDFLKAIGSEAKPGEDQQEWADALDDTTGGIVQALLDWSCYDSENKVEIAGSYDEFPVDPADPTKRLPFITVKQKDGTDKRFRANQRIRFYKG